MSQTNATTILNEITFDFKKLQASANQVKEELDLSEVENDKLRAALAEKRKDKRELEEKLLHSAEQLKGQLLSYLAQLRRAS